MQIPSNSTCRFGRTHVLFDKTLLHAPSPAVFCSPTQGDAVNQHGRTAAYYVTLQGHSCVLKHYRRGGLLRHVVTRQYAFTGTARSRMWQEYHLLQAMRAKGLPVPRPIAALCDIHPGTSILPPLTCSGSLITERIERAQTLSDTLDEHTLEAKQWQRIGQLIRLFHDKQVYHADLNANNILWQDNKNLYLIDFDKSFFKPANQAKHWKAANLQRLLRSLIKLKPRHFSEKGWAELLLGYQKPVSDAVID